MAYDLVKYGTPEVGERRKVVVWNGLKAVVVEAKWTETRLFSYRQNDRWERLPVYAHHIFGSMEDLFDHPQQTAAQLEDDAERLRKLSRELPTEGDGA